MLVKAQERVFVPRRVMREITYATFMGGIPTVLSSATVTELRNAVNALLAAPALMTYYAILMVVCVIFTGFSFRTRLRSPSHHMGVRKTQSFFADIGGSFLMALRAALGAMLGFILVWATSEPETISAEAIIRMCLMISTSLACCVWLAWMEETFKNPYGFRRYE
ncbi:hypothetical protein [Pseudomonas putida]|uniref:hypothetical protein n=1 Tax=Pseudomonas putida TaxID=303 RepID=UPI0009A1997E|nr:hypothetical protein [Pseudomonas putida]